MSASQLSYPKISSRKLQPNWVWLLCLFILVVVLIKPAPVGGDTTLYVDDVRNSLSHGWGESHQIWNFAHLAWRPIGRLLAEAFLHPLLPFFGNNVDMTITFLFTLPNIITALICGLVIQRAVWKITGNSWAALLIAFAFLCLNPLLNYSRLGSPYCCCLACTTLALYLAAFHDSGSWRVAAVAGALGGVAAVLWAPFLLSFPAIVLSRWILGFRGGKKFDFRFAAAACISGALVVIACYAVAMGINHIHDVKGVVAWMHESTPDSRDRTALRMLNGIARGVFEMGDDSVWLKWFLFHDPYAKVRVWELVRLSMIELGLFYITMLALVLALWVTPFGKRLLALVVISTVPHVLVAVVYEGGSVERYIAFLPVVFIAFGYIVGSAAYSKRIRVLIAVLCCIHAPANLATASVRNVSYLVHRDPDRLSTMTSLGPNSRLFVINGRDSLMRLSYGDPLNPLHRQPLASVLAIAPSLGPDVPYWREIFSCAVFDSWKHGGQALVTARVLADQPVRAWGWVEGDDNRLKWNDIHQFFTVFDHRQQRGGSDGFFAIQDTPEAVRTLLSNIRGGTEQGCELSRLP